MVPVVVLVVVVLDVVVCITVLEVRAGSRVLCVSVRECRVTAALHSPACPPQLS